MNNNSINDEMIAGYLLGELPDEQAERLDELARDNGRPRPQAVGRTQRASLGAR